MTYFVFETATVDNQRANAVTVKENYNEALMLFHQIRASVLANANVTYSLTMIIDEQGNIINRETSSSTNTTTSD